MLADEGAVVAQVLVEVAAPTGFRLCDDEMHLWRFAADGRVSAMRHYLDTAAHLAAWRGEVVD